MGRLGAGNKVFSVCVRRFFACLQVLAIKAARTPKESPSRLHSAGASTAHRQLWLRRVRSRPEQ